MTIRNLDKHVIIPTRGSALEPSEALLAEGWIEFAFSVGRIVDIALSEERVMVLVESPKVIWRNHPAEWLEYQPEAIKPATPERIARDFETCRAHIAKMAQALETLQAELPDAMIEQTATP